MLNYDAIHLKSLNKEGKEMSSVESESTSDIKAVQNPQLRTQLS